MNAERFGRLDTNNDGFLSRAELQAFQTVGEAVITGISPSEAWIFGGVVAQISGQNLSEGTVIRFGNVTVEGFRASADNRTIDVIVPESTDVSNNDFVDVTVSVRNGGQAQASLFNSFPLQPLCAGERR